MHRLYKLPQVTINNKKQLLKDGETFKIGNIKIHAFLVPGHTWGHMVYLIDDKYLFTGDTIWFGADGGYSFISALAESNKLAVRSLGILEQKLKKMCVNRCLLRDIQVLPTTLNLHLHIRKSCVHRLKNESS